MKKRDPTRINDLEINWTLLRQIDAGGFGKVYEAESRSGDSAVIKLIPKDPGADRELLGGRLSLTEVIVVLTHVSMALKAIQGRIVHRDIKPENILLLEGNWCLADFGIARYAEATTAPNTFKYSMTRAYAAPEQWREERATSATDVYALGVVAFELLAAVAVQRRAEVQRQQSVADVAAARKRRLRATANQSL